ncbi:unnamed protein product [Ilex paraguariensis]|uniref:Uncharacterized protein n=1 Tax=Ilex paraguariensis TaxID=185542 RepID=A0ABC8U0M6_9AQUA
MDKAPAKSRPLHNFSLPFLKWGHKNHNNTNHRFRRPSESSHSSPEHHRSSPPEPESEFESESEKRNKPPVESRITRDNRFSFSPCLLHKQQKNPVVSEREFKNEADGDKSCGDGGEGEELVAKPWNLRPRKVATKVAAEEIGTVSLKNGKSQERVSTVLAIPAVTEVENLPKSLRLRGFVEGQGSEKKEKRKLWISLSKEEIEEDVYALTGGRPSRRPKKRPKNVQKFVDNLFPGLYLVGATADSYRVHEAPG